MKASMESQAGVQWKRGACEDDADDEGSFEEKCKKVEALPAKQVVQPEHMPISSKPEPQHTSQSDAKQENGHKPLQRLRRVDHGLKVDIPKRKLGLPRENKGLVVLYRQTKGPTLRNTTPGTRQLYQDQLQVPLLHRTGSQDSAGKGIPQYDRRSKSLRIKVSNSQDPRRSKSQGSSSAPAILTLPSDQTLPSDPLQLQTMDSIAPNGTILRGKGSDNLISSTDNTITVTSTTDDEWRDVRGGDSDVRLGRGGSMDGSYGSIRRRRISTRSSRSMLTLGGRSHDKVHTSPLVGSIKRTKRQTEGMDEQEKRKVTLVVEVMKMLVEERRHSAIRY